MSTVAGQVHEATRLDRWVLWTGRLLSAGAILILLMSARWKLTFDPWYVQEWGRIGWTASALPRIALIQLACVVLYVTPRRSWVRCCSPAISAAPSPRTPGSENLSLSWSHCRRPCSPGRDSTCGRNAFDACSRSAERRRVTTELRLSSPAGRLASASTTARSRGRTRRSIPYRAQWPASSRQSTGGYTPSDRRR